MISSIQLVVCLHAGASLVAPLRCDLLVLFLNSRRYQSYGDSMPSTLKLLSSTNVPLYLYAIQKQFQALETF